MRFASTLILVSLVASEGCGGGGGASTPDGRAASAADAAAPTPDAPPDAQLAPVFGELGQVVVSEIPTETFAVEGTTAGGGYSTYNTRTFSAADLNGDGRLDIFASPSFGRYRPEVPVKAWLNEGGGKFREGTREVFAPPVPYTGLGVRQALGDFNGDGRIDIFIFDTGLEVGQFDGHRNDLFLSAGDGLLHDATSATPPTYPLFNHGAARGDFDGNGCEDLVVTALGTPVTQRGGVYLLLGDCHGGFVHSIVGVPKEIAELSLLDGFEPGVDYQAPYGNGAGDLDGDGVPDLISGAAGLPDVIGGYPSIRFYKNLGGAVFVEKKRIPVPKTLGTASDAMVNALVGDLDGDGRNDVVLHLEIEGGTAIEILRNDGDWSFTDVTMDAFGAYVTTLPGFDVAGLYRLDDVDGDGDLDLVFAHNRIGPDQLAGRGFVFLNDGHGKLSPLRLTKNRRPASAAEIAAALPAAIPDFERAGISMMFDADGDGVKDVVIIGVRNVKTGDVFQPDLVRVFAYLAGRLPVASKR